MGALLHHAPAIEHHNLVGVAHGAQAVGHHHHGFATVELLQVLHNGTLVVGIEGIGGLIE